MDIVNIVVILLSPVIAVIVGQILQDRGKKRNDKMEIFKALMVSRGLGWSVDSVKALNTIEVVFNDDKKVLEQWKVLYDKLCVENPSETELLKIKNERDKLLDVMAKSLGYKDSITWETIQNPYIPKGLTDNMLQQQQYMNSQSEIMIKMNAYLQQMNFPTDELKKQ